MTLTVTPGFCQGCALTAARGFDIILTVVVAFPQLRGVWVQMDIHAIFNTLPHRYPFLMVDRILEIEPGRRAVGIKNVTINEPYFTGHWPGEPVMPGVLIVEAMAQVAGMFLLAGTQVGDQQAFLGGIDKVRFRRQVVPGDQLIIEAELIKRRGSIGKVQTVAKVGDEIACQGELTFALVAADSETSA